MTVSTTINKVSYIGNGIATSFAVPFPFLEKDHLKVFQLLNDVQTERTDWTILNENIVFLTAPADGAQILIIREVPFTQETDYRENEILPAETLERNFDKLTMQVQQLKEQADRAVTVDIFDNTDATGLIPSIKQAVSDCAMYVMTATQKAQQAVAQAQNAATSAQSAETSRQSAVILLDSKADKTTYASKSMRGVALWASGKENISEIRPARIIECYQNGNNWYRVWSDGWIEQGGYLSSVSSGTTGSAVTFLKPFSNTNYFSSPSWGGAQYAAFGIKNRTTTGMTVVNRSNEATFCYWQACGY